MSPVLAGTFSTTAAAKSLQSCPTLCDPIDGSPPGSLIPGILQARTLEWVHLEPGPDGGLVMLDDTTVLEKALEILKEAQPEAAEEETKEEA